MEFIVKNLSTKTHRPNGMKGKFCQTFEEIISILHKFFQKTEEEGICPIYSMRPTLP